MTKLIGKWKMERKVDFEEFKEELWCIVVEFGEPILNERDWTMWRERERERERERAVA